MLKDDLNYYEFSSLGSLADLPAKYVRRGIRRKGASKEVEDPVADADTPIEDLEAEAARSAAELEEEVYINNRIWTFLDPRLREAESIAGYRFKIEKVESDDFHGQIFMVNGKWYTQQGQAGDPPQPIFVRVFGRAQVDPEVVANDRRAAEEAAAQRAA